MLVRLGEAGLELQARRRKRAGASIGKELLGSATAFREYVRALAHRSRCLGAPRARPTRSAREGSRAEQARAAESSTATHCPDST